MGPRGQGSRTVLGLLACVLVSFAVLAYPVYVIRPFRQQGARELAAALALTQFRPLLELVLMAATLTLLVLTWRQSRAGLSRFAAVTCTLLVILFGFLSRVNVYEMMFHPLDRLSFSPAPKARLEGGEEVIAVRVNGAARAYPIRSMSYHHIVNDVAGGVPIVATY